MSKETEEFEKRMYNTSLKEDREGLPKYYTRLEVRIMLKALEEAIEMKIKR